MCACACVCVLIEISLHMHRVGLCTDNSSMAVSYFQQNNMFEVMICIDKPFSRSSVHSVERSVAKKKKKTISQLPVESDQVVCAFLDATALHLFSLLFNDQV